MRPEVGKSRRKSVGAIFFQIVNIAECIRDYDDDYDYDYEGVWKGLLGWNRAKL